MYRLTAAAWIRLAAVGMWAGIAVLIARIGSGGWPGGILWVVQVESTPTLVAGALALVMSVGFAVALASGQSRTTAAWSAMAAPPVALLGIHLRVIGHASGDLIVLGAIAALCLSIALRRAAGGCSLR